MLISVFITFEVLPALNRTAIPAQHNIDEQAGMVRLLDTLKSTYWYNHSRPLQCGISKTRVTDKLQQSTAAGHVSAASRACCELSHSQSIWILPVRPDQYGGGLTLVHHSGSAMPSLNFWPDVYVIIIPRQHILRTVPTTVGRRQTLSPCRAQIRVPPVRISLTSNCLSAAAQLVYLCSVYHVASPATMQSSRRHSSPHLSVCHWHMYSCNCKPATTKLNGIVPQAGSKLALCVMM
jgi:hypothetical protein